MLWSTPGQQTWGDDLNSFLAIAEAKFGALLIQKMSGEPKSLESSKILEFVTGWGGGFWRQERGNLVILLDSHIHNAVPMTNRRKNSWQRFERELVKKAALELGELIYRQLEQKLCKRCPWLSWTLPYGFLAGISRLLLALKSKEILRVRCPKPFLAVLLDEMGTCQCCDIYRLFFYPQS